MNPDPQLMTGVDFTSAPSPKKAITVAWASLQKKRLTLLTIQRLCVWSDFERLLALPNYQGVACQWMALDFPFSLPTSFLRAVNWPTDWSTVMARLATMTKPQFEQWIQAYCDSQPAGQKFHFRPTDRVTRSSSPMKLFYPPVGKMLYQGAVRLHQAKQLAVLPFRSLPNATCCIEGYPALVAQALNRSLNRASKPVKQPYKSDSDKSAFVQARHHLLQQLVTPGSLALYGVDQVIISDDWIQACQTDASGDMLDAVFCAVQAAWASQQPNGGIPLNAIEGWIVDPICLQNDSY